MYKDDIKSFLQSKSVKQVVIPNHVLITELEKRLEKKEWERACLVLNYVFRTHRHSIRTERKICDRKFELYQLPIFHSIKVALLGNTYLKSVMSALSESGIITVEKKNFWKPEAGLSLPTVYAVNRDVWNAPEKTITLTTQNAINAWTQWLVQRQIPFTRVDRDVVNRQHKHLHYDTTGEEYAREHRRDALAKARAEAIDGGKVFDPGAWRKGFIFQCRQIDSWNQIPDREKWILCRVDNFGLRLHHGLTNCPASLRQYSRIGEMVPLFEIDLKSSQPTFTAINMLSRGFTDSEFFTDINDGLLYERYAQKRGLNWSREKAKTMIFTALFGNEDSSELKNLAVVYPVLAQYLREIKTEKRIKEFQTIEGYKPSKNNCIDVQRAESAWAHKVWKDLTKTGMRFLPIHDSVIVYGYENTLSEKIGMMQFQTENIMKSNFSDAVVVPKFKITEYLNSEDFSSEESEDFDYQEDVETSEITEETPKIAVFLCVWKRLGNLSGSLSQLKAQTFKKFDLFIINNNPQKYRTVETIVSNSLKDSGIDCQIIHSKINHGPMIRYSEAVRLGYEYSVFLDDDETFKETMMEEFDRVKEPKSLKAQMGFTFVRDLKARKRVLEGTAKVLGPGGMILDTSILTPDFFSKWRIEFYVCDDLWLSFFAEKKGYKKEVASLRVFLNKENNPEIAMLYNENISYLKQKFVEDYGWFD